MLDLQGFQPKGALTDSNRGHSEPQSIIMTFVFLNSLQGHASCRCLDNPDNLSF